MKVTDCIIQEVAIIVFDDNKKKKYKRSANNVWYSIENGLTVPIKNKKILRQFETAYENYRISMAT